jgi:hypothetical protein
MAAYLDRLSNFVPWPIRQTRLDRRKNASCFVPLLDDNLCTNAPRSLMDSRGILPLGNPRCRLELILYILNPGRELHPTARG